MCSGGITVGSPSSEDGTVYTSLSCLQPWLISERDSGRLWLVSMSFLTAETLPARPFLILYTHTHNATMAIDTVQWPLCVFIPERSKISFFSSMRRLLSLRTLHTLLAERVYSNATSSLTPPLSDPSLFKYLYTCQQEESIKGWEIRLPTSQMVETKAHSFDSTNTRLSTEFASPGKSIWVTGDWSDALIQHGELNSCSLMGNIYSRTEPVIEVMLMLSVTLLYPTLWCADSHASSPSVQHYL